MFFKASELFYGASKFYLMNDNYIHNNNEDPTAEAAWSKLLFIDSAW